MTPRRPHHHVDPDPADCATAPYNFVPLPEEVLDAGSALGLTDEREAPWSRQDRPAGNTLSGEIEVELVATTGVFVRGPRDPRSDLRPGLRHRPAVARGPDGEEYAVIPGSSWRGWVRTLAEILAFARIGDNVSRQRSFYRTLGDDRVGKAYGNRLAPGGTKPPGGFARRREDGSWYIAPQKVLRVPHPLLSSRLGKDSQALLDAQRARANGGEDPWIKVHVRRDGLDVVEDLSLTPRPGFEEGTLVVTGQVPKKRHEFVVLEPDGAAAGVEIEIPAEVLDRFNDEDQLTQFQQDQFPEHGSSRSRPGELGDGDPVFYVLDAEGKRLSFLGRARMFRFPYYSAPADLVPASHRPAASPDLVEGTFGRVETDPEAGRKGKREAVEPIRGRVRFEALRSVDPVHLSDDDIRVPAVLSSPKTTTYPHYLAQASHAGRGAYNTYIRGDDTTIRGFKLYWTPTDGAPLRAYTGPAPSETRQKRPRDEADARRILLALARGKISQEKARGEGTSQLTLMQPVPEGTRFRGRIRFEGLHAVELGMLLTALRPFEPERFRHRLGGGKPHRLGALRLERMRLRLLSHEERYGSWAAGGWEEPGDASPHGNASLRRQFAEVIRRHAEHSGEQTNPRQDGLRRLRRLDALALMLDPRVDESTDLAEPMTLEGYKKRRVLPTPHGAVRRQPGDAAVYVPEWEEQDRARAPRPASKGGGGGKGGPHRPRQPNGESQARRPVQQARRREPAGNTTATAILRRRGRTAQEFEFELEGFPGIVARLHGSVTPLPDYQPGHRALMRVVKGGPNPRLAPTD